MRARFTWKGAAANDDGEAAARGGAGPKVRAKDEANLDAAHASRFADKVCPRATDDTFSQDRRWRRMPSALTRISNGRLIPEADAQGAGGLDHVAGGRNGAESANRFGKLH